MANRHAHTKLRAEIRARMRATGETYQQARERILSRAASGVRADLVPFTYFGLPGTLATFETPAGATFALLPSSTLWGKGYPSPLPLALLRGLSRPRGVQ